jgi:hypothetical protein
MSFSKKNKNKNFLLLFEAYMSYFKKSHLHSLPVFPSTLPNISIRMLRSNCMLHCLVVTSKNENSDTAISNAETPRSHPASNGNWFRKPWDSAIISPLIVLLKNHQTTIQRQILHLNTLRWRSSATCRTIFGNGFGIKLLMLMPQRR